MQHGPGPCLGSNDPDLKAREILQHNLDRIDRCIKGPLNRWEEVLRLLEKEVPLKGEWPWQDAQILVDLRNELVHYRSNFGGTTKRPELVAALRSRKFSAAPFIPSGTDEFPLRLLCADCAE